VTKTKQNSPLSLFFRIALPIILATLLIIVLVYFGNVDFQQLGTFFSQLNIFHILIIIFSSLFHMTTSALKWQLVLKAFHHDNANHNPPFSFHLFYTTLGANLGQVMPIHISSMITRGIGLKAHYQGSTLSGAASSGFEQIFDILIPLVLLLPTIFVLTFDMDLSTWLAISAFILILSGLLLPLVSIKLVESILRLIGPMAEQPKRTFFLRKSLDTVLKINNLDKTLMTKLYWLSVIRFFSLLIRALVVVSVIASTITYSAVTIALPGVVSTNIIALTPGGLGISEWGWTGLLLLQNVSMQDAVAFALLNRIVMILGLLTILAFSALAFFGRNKI